MIDTIVNSFDIWTDAQGIKSRTRIKSVNNISLEGIARLRELILELAILGKLVPQDPNDEPAVELLQRIEKERIRMVKEGEFKKLDSFPEIKEYEVPFKLPKNWGLTQLGLVCEIIRGITFSSSEKSTIPEAGRVACLRTTNVQDKIEWDDLLFIREVLVTRKDQFLKEKDIVMSMANSRELVGKVAIVDKLPLFKAAFGGFLGVLRPIIIDPFYLMLLLRVKTNRDSLIDSASQTTNIANISLAKLYPLRLAIPPLSEQHRIVAKVAELMALCDKLDEEQFTNLKTHHVLVKTLLESLTQAADANELQTAWERMSTHFDTLFSTEDSIEQLKQTILQLAVMGKLVKQDPNDEPASELLKQIAEAKEILIEEGKLRKQLPLPKIIEDEKPFELPKGWEWLKFGELSLFINGDRSKNYPHTSEYLEEGIAWINTGHIEPTGRLSTIDMNFISREKFNSLRSGKIKKGDMVYCLRGATFGKTAFVEPYEEGAIASSLMIIRPFDTNLRNYIYLYLISPFAKQQLLRFDNGSAQPNLSANSVLHYSFPLPPLSEQYRIVSKVDELFTLCESLKEKILKSQNIKVLLSKTIVEKAVK